MIIPAIKTPKLIITSAFFFSIPKTKAISAPLQAPVKGSGIATNGKRVQTAYFSTFLECFLRVYSKSQEKNQSHCIEAFL